MFEIVHEKLHHPSNHWICYSYVCGTQLKSGYVVADMLHATENYQVKSVSFNYFESITVKVILIVLGQLSNFHLLEVCLCRNRQFNIDDILAAIQNKSKQSTKTIHFFIVDFFIIGWFQKRLANWQHDFTFS